METRPGTEPTVTQGTAESFPPRGVCGAGSSRGSNKATVKPSSTPWNTWLESQGDHTCNAWEWHFNYLM